MATTFGERVQYAAGTTTFAGASLIPGDVAAFPGWSISNLATPRRSMGAGEQLLGNIAEYVATLICELQEKKILNGTPGLYIGGNFSDQGGGEPPGGGDEN